MGMVMEMVGDRDKDGYLAFAVTLAFALAIALALALALPFAFAFAFIVPGTVALQNEGADGCCGGPGMRDGEG